MKILKKFAIGRKKRNVFLLVGALIFTLTIGLVGVKIFTNIKNTNAAGSCTTKYTIAADTAYLSRGVVYGGGNYCKGEKVTLRAVPKTGYRFVKWENNSTTNPRTVTVTGNASYTAVFEAIPKYTIAADTTYLSMGVVYGSGEYYEGSTATLTATPKSGYEFVKWSDNNTDNPRTVTVTSNASYTAIFQAKPKYTIAADTTYLSMGVVYGGGDYYKGEKVTLRAVPKTGYRFVKWENNSTTNPRTVTVTGNASYTAVFEAIPKYTIAADTTYLSMGVVYGSGEYYEGSTATLTATPKSGYEFVKWSDNNTDNPRTVTVTSNASYTAIFQAEPQQSQYIIAADTTYLSRGVVYGGGNYGYGETAILRAIPKSGYEFVGWDDDNTDNPRTVTVTGNASYTAIFEARPKYIIAADTTYLSRGVVYGSGEYYRGETATLTAVPNSGYRFVGWSDNNTDNPRTVTATSNANYTANFEEIPQYTITASSDSLSKGVVYGDGEYYEGETATLTAKARSGYEFVGWDDDNTDNPRVITVTDDEDYSAVFRSISKRMINADAEDLSMGVVYGGGEYYEGETVTLTATPNSGYEFVGWDDGDSNSSRTITVNDDDEDYVAVFRGVKNDEGDDEGDNENNNENNNTDDKDNKTDEEEAEVPKTGDKKATAPYTGANTDDGDGNILATGLLIPILIASIISVVYVVKRRRHHHINFN